MAAHAVGDTGASKKFLSASLHTQSRGAKTKRGTISRFGSSQQVDLELGWFWKSGEKVKKRGAWQKRYFRFRAGSFYYYGSEKETSLKGVIDAYAILGWMERTEDRSSFRSLNDVSVFSSTKSTKSAALQSTTSPGIVFFTNDRCWVLICTEPQQLNKLKEIIFLYARPLKIVKEGYLLKEKARWKRSFNKRYVLVARSSNLPVVLIWCDNENILTLRGYYKLYNKEDADSSFFGLDNANQFWVRTNVYDSKKICSFRSLDGAESWIAAFQKASDTAIEKKKNRQGNTNSSKKLKRRTMALHSKARSASGPKKSASVRGKSLGSEKEQKKRVRGPRRTTATISSFDDDNIEDKRVQREQQTRGIARAGSLYEIPVPSPKGARGKLSPRSEKRRESITTAATKSRARRKSTRPMSDAPSTSEEKFQDLLGPEMKRRLSKNGKNLLGKSLNDGGNDSLESRQRQSILKLQKVQSEKNVYDGFKREFSGLIDERVEFWAREPGSNANKPLPVLLSSLQEHFPDLFSMPVVSFGPDPTEATTKSAITKGYRKALLKVHPDRMHSVQPQQKITAEKVFAIIHGSFQSWRNSC